MADERREGWLVGWLAGWLVGWLAGVSMALTFDLEVVQCHALNDKESKRDNRH